MLTRRTRARSENQSYIIPRSSALPCENNNVTFALGRSIKKAGMRPPEAVFSQKCLDGCRYVGDGGWNKRELIRSPMIGLERKQIGLLILVSQNEEVEISVVPPKVYGGHWNDIFVLQ
eukprot:5271168-Ditylum_brightwellii.AAC.1